MFQFSLFSYKIVRVRVLLGALLFGWIVPLLHVICALVPAERTFLEGVPISLWLLSRRRIAEKAMTLSVFFHYKAWTVRLDPIAPKWRYSKPILLRSRLCEYQWHSGHSVFVSWNSGKVRDFFFNYASITLIKRHGSLWGSMSFGLCCFQSSFTHQQQNEYIN